MRQYLREIVERMGKMAEFANAQLDIDERVAMAACGSRWSDGPATAPEHWRWECEADDTPLDVDLAIAGNAEFVDHGDEHFRVGLRSAEEYPAGSDSRPLPHLVLDTEELRPQDARHLSRFDPARIMADVESGRRLVARHADCGYGAGFCGDGGHSFDGDGCGTLADYVRRWSGAPGYETAVENGEVVKSGRLGEA